MRVWLVAMAVVLLVVWPAGAAGQDAPVPADQQACALGQGIDCATLIASWVDAHYRALAARPVCKGLAKDACAPAVGVWVERHTPEIEGVRHRICRWLPAGECTAVVQQWVLTRLGVVGGRGVMVWIDAQHGDLQKVDLGFATLAGAVFDEADMRGAQLYGAVLPGASFEGARLGDAVFLAADLRRADFRGATLEGADFRGASLTHSRFGAKRPSSFDDGGTHVAEAMRPANLSHTDFTGADLSMSNLAGADLEGTILVGANLSGTPSRATPDPRRGPRSRMARALRSTPSCSPHCEGANLTDANLTRADLTGADLTNANLTGANLTGADLTFANLAGANLTGANLTKASLDFVTLAGANLTHANLSHADLIGRDLTNANLTGANLTGANLLGANLKGANLTGATWTNAICPDGAVKSTGCVYRPPDIGSWIAFNPYA